ncbi:MAG: F0F1 ATP synthase subunit delta [Candidatus Pacebacteria bacterium GW2011_GWB1_47_8]|nr:MAG: F0F1 ATP synthase subunit delta [Candidatus Pacebacteria bacterium GW2011_GWA1_46_10]KKU84504.1 MAG: F0F1 ATP synthase subunit delta [Candidatus Pacebacteria bacterium GW2011_GWB1_47_8]HCR81404.1 hypothetical protein [Candidatus Paceibacterota bacterium]
MLKVIVTTATPLEKGLTEKLKAAMNKKHGRELEFVFAVEPSVIGGIRVVVGSKAVDATVAGKLAQVRKQLLAQLEK